MQIPSFYGTDVSHLNACMLCFGMWHTIK